MGFMISGADSEINLKIHGRYKIETRGRVLSVDATGPYNEEIVYEYRRELIASVEALAPDPWSMLVILHAESVFTPAAEMELTKLIKWRITKGMNKVGLVFIQPIGSEVIESQMSRIYDTAGVEHAYFDTIDNARVWLEDLDKTSD